MIPRLFLGTANWGTAVLLPEAERLLDCALDHGLGIDTANCYGTEAFHQYRKDSAETMLGQLMTPARRARMFLATKVGNPMPDGDHGLSAVSVRRQCEGSLKRLRVAKIDLYQTHNRDDQTPWDETTGALATCARDGLIGAFGACNVTADQLRAAQLSCVRDGSRGWQTVQVLANLLHPVDPSLARYAQTCEIPILAYSPLAGGVLTGKYMAAPAWWWMSTAVPTRGLEFMRMAGELSPRLPSYIPKITCDVLPLLAFAAQRGLTLTELSLRWLLSQPIHGIILGARSLKQLETQLAILDQGPLPADVLSSLTDDLLVAR